jgi:hypothetical protein
VRVARRGVVGVDREAWAPGSIVRLQRDRAPAGISDEVVAQGRERSAAVRAGVLRDDRILNRDERILDGTGLDARIPAPVAKKPATALPAIVLLVMVQ